MHTHTQRVMKNRNANLQISFLSVFNIIKCQTNCMNWNWKEKKNILENKICLKKKKLGEGRDVWRCSS